jgi:hypothetical protein
MELNLSEKVNQILSFILLIALPLLVLLIGITLDILNAWYYILAVTWFATGVIIYSALRE